MHEMDGMLVRLPEATVIALARRAHGRETITEVIDRLARADVPGAFGASPKKTTSQPTTRSRADGDRYTITVLGEKAPFPSLADCLVHAVDKLAGLDPAFLPEFAKRGGRTRRHVADSRHAVHPGRPDLLEHVRELPSHPGWWVGTNYSRDDVERILKDASNVVSLDYGPDIRLENCS